MGLRYKEIGRLLNGHSKGITKVAFSPEGKYVATAGLDGKVCVWDVGSTRLLHSFDGNCAVLSLVWMPSADEALLCGLKDGNMALMRITESDASITGFWAHGYPVECLALNPRDNRLASGAHSELYVWSWNRSTGRFHLDNALPEPLKSGWNKAVDEIVTSIHWTSSAKFQDLLLVTYMYHGALLLDTRDWTQIRTVIPNGQIASASLSDDGMRLAICNSVRGFLIYCMKTGAMLGAIDHSEGENARPQQVIFIHGSLALVGGSTTGELRVWDVLDTVTSGPALNVPEASVPKPTVMDVLPIPRRAKALAVGAHYCEERDEFFIAAGAMNESSPSTCVLWKATEQGSAPGQGYAAVTAHLRVLVAPKSLLAFVLAALGAALVAYLQVDP